MTEEQHAQELLFSARAKIDAGDLDGAYADLAEVDQLDDSRAKETTNLRHEIAGLRQGVQPSAGTSSSVSERAPDRSGPSLPATESSPQWPVPAVDSLLSKDLAPKPAFSSASLTDGSGQETGSGQESLPASSAAFSPPTPATPVQHSSETGTAGSAMVVGGEHLIALARQEFDKGDYASADRLLTEAGAADATLLPQIAGYRTAVVNAARAAGVTLASEQDPSQGGFLAGGTTS